MAGVDLVPDRRVQDLLPLGLGLVERLGKRTEEGVERLGCGQDLRGTGEVPRRQVLRVDGIRVGLTGRLEATAAHDERRAIPERGIRGVAAGELHGALLYAGRQRDQRRDGDQAGAYERETE